MNDIRKKRLEALTSYLAVICSQKNIEIRSHLKALNSKLIKNKRISKGELEIVLKFLVNDSKDSLDTLRDKYLCLTRPQVNPRMTTNTLEQFMYGGD